MKKRLVSKVKSPTFLPEMKSLNKHAQFNFVWLFAIIVGGAILLLAIYGAIKTGDTERFKTDTKIAKELSILTNPLQSGFSEGSFGSILFKDETKIRNVCFSQNGTFGKNELSVATRSDIGEEWNLLGGATSIYNKYIFSSEKNSGKEYYVFSKPFEFPYKVTDIIFITPENYCFINAPEEVSDEVANMRFPNIKISSDCTLPESINVCFGSGTDCDIAVYGTKVIKNGEEMSYVGSSLMYAAIFSDKGIYDCNIERMMYRTSKIAGELSEKTDIMNSRDCSTNLKVSLLYWESSTSQAKANNFVNLKNEADNLEKLNNRELCRVW
ncbi:MAG: hypothetical protein NUV97_00515 [archaeon]|nr:hypothetical protein [archaeon]